VPQQLEIIQEILPNIKSLGVLYNPNEINSMRMIEALKKVMPNSLTLVEAHANSANEVATAARSLVGKVEAIYIPADNTVVAQIDTVLTLTAENNIPVFASEHGSVDKGALAALAYDQYEVGYLSGRMAGQILAGKNPGKMDVVKPAHPSLYINTKTMQQLKIQIPDHLLKSAENLKS
jgi:putative tryptophan/tyrosine transport system substrate-binding protein